MNTISFTKRTRLFLMAGAKAGIKVSFWSSIAYAISVILFFLVFTVFLPVINPSSSMDRNLFLQELLVGSLFVMIAGGALTSVLGIIPAIFVGLIGGATIGLTLALWTKRRSNPEAALIGLAIGVLFIVLANYLAWQFLYVGNSFTEVSFWEFILPVGRSDIINLYIIPSMLVLLISLYLGWRINKTGIAENPENQDAAQSNEEINVSTQNHSLP